MANEKPFPHARNNVSPTAVDPGSANFSNAPTDRYSMNVITKPCGCAVCTGPAFDGPPTWYAPYHQSWDTRPPGDDNYTNQGQGVGNPVGASFAAPNLRFQDQSNPDPLQAGVNSTQALATAQPVQFHQDPTSRASVADGLRRLADRYVNNPDSVVGVVRLEPGPSGGFQVVIILEVAGLL